MSIGLRYRTRMIPSTLAFDLLLGTAVSQSSAVQPMVLLGQAPAVFVTIERPNETDLAQEMQRLEQELAGHQAIRDDLSARQAPLEVLRFYDCRANGCSAGSTFTKTRWQVSRRLLRAMSPRPRRYWPVTKRCGPKRAALARLGYDVQLEERRPITFDQRGNPSDVVFMADSRGRALLAAMEPDAVGGPRPPMSVHQENDTGAQPPAETPPPPDVAKGETYYTYLVNLYNHYNNLGLPASFWEEATEQMLAQNEAGDTSKRTVNIWHPRVRQVTDHYFQAVGRTLRTDARFLLYDGCSIFSDAVNSS